MLEKEVKSKKNLLKSVLGKEEVESMEEILPEVFKKDREDLKDRANYLNRASKTMKLKSAERLTLLTSLKAWTLDRLTLKELFAAYNHSRNKKRRNVDLLIQSLEQETPVQKYYKDT